MKKKVWIISAVVLLLLLLVAYGVGCWYFYGHFYYGTMIDGELCGCLTVEQSQELLISKSEGYELTIQGRNSLSDTLSSEETGWNLEPAEELEKIIGYQRWWLWPLSYFESHSYELTESVELDEELFAAALQEMSIFDPENITEPEDAELSAYDPESKGYYIVEEIEGNQILREEAAGAIRSALLARQSELDLTDGQYYEQPSVRVDDEELVSLMERMNSYTQITVTYDMHGIEVVLDGDTISEWLSVEDGAVSIDRELTDAWVEELADTYNTYGKSRSFTTISGETMTLRGGAYGWKLDVETEQESLLELLEKGKSTSHTPAWTKEGYVTGTNDIGSTYVEIDLGAQHLYVIVRGTVVFESDFVSGNVADGSTTPSGVFGITYKATDAVLRGDDYVTPVSYWMPFNGNIGMHDATWRSSFGGDIYLTNGSHGCINLPLSAAKQIYGLVETNMPVICYY